MVSEVWLLHQTNRLSHQLQSSLSVSQREALTLRLVGELSEFLLPREVKEGEAQGRTSGDVTWRQARGELGMTQQPEQKSMIWTPSEIEMNNGEFCLEYRYQRICTRIGLCNLTPLNLIVYSASLDKYIRRSDGDTTIDKWQNGVFEAESVFRKTENDWKMAYLARLGKK